MAIQFIHLQIPQFQHHPIRNPRNLKTTLKDLIFNKPGRQNSDLVFHFRSHQLISPPSDRDGNEKLKTDAVEESAPEFEPTVVVAAVYAS